ncbi:MAG: GAF domain-containing protein [Leptolyngbyaceae cyanobacterium SM1_1_3]|nr:GAF domain-containing protein [Leptolyngbyaceae cyanobacterium SM1_1_3]NJN04333.1 GAF domain-containing protein [Leptolyngbyaceae cyanobacterium RM1_1_2]NJO10559.1 GAF domain-containing protein [Leptolyngbyaceae cyanobacterium SL_1_1]
MLEPSSNPYSWDSGLQRVVDRLSKNLERDRLVQTAADQLKTCFQADRVVLYYFYRQWKGQVTFESLSHPRLSIYGSTGADECFNDEYAERYLAGRIRAIDDVEQSTIQPCHSEFLRSIQVKANLAAPILTQQGLWGLLIAHHCQASRHWTPQDIEAIRAAANQLATAPSICQN